MSSITNVKSYNDLASDSLWNKISLRFKEEFGAEIYDKWLTKLQLHSYLEQEIIMSVSSKFLRDWIKREYLDNNNYNFGGKNIKEIWLEENPKLKKIALIYLENEAEKIAAEKEKSTEDNQQNTVINLSKYDNVFALGIELNPKFTFENFVVGKCNQLAFGMAQLMAKTESANINSKFSANDINPLFLYGGVGLGKTHLAQSIAWHIKENSKNSKVIYLSAERFMYQFVQSLRSNEVMDFKTRFRGVDLLIIDDLQFVTGKEGTQQELLHTLSSLIENNKQIVLVCDKSPGDLANMDEKLKRILKAVKEGKILLIEGRLDSLEESELIKRTMQVISKDFKGIEIASIDYQFKGDFFEKLRKDLAHYLLRKKSGLTIVGPATIVKEIRKDPSKIELLTMEKKKR